MQLTHPALIFTPSTALRTDVNDEGSGLAIKKGDTLNLFLGKETRLDLLDCKT